jgi:hypothetical protein
LKQGEFGAIGERNRESLGDYGTDVGYVVNTYLPLLSPVSHLPIAGSTAIWEASCRRRTYSSGRLRKEKGNLEISSRIYYFA